MMKRFRLFISRSALLSQEENSVTLASFTGQWIGETQGYDMPAHLWEITQYGDYLHLMTRWEGESTSARFQAQLVPGEPSFQILYMGGEGGKATLVDKQHFVIPGWCWGTTRVKDGKIGEFDVVFSRPGIAELTGRAAYLKSLGKSDQPPASED
jgi:hypothetical protein